MSRLNWNVPEGRFFDTGLDRGVLYPKGTPPLGPIIATNLATNASFETAGSVSAVETNWLTNPNFNTNISGWAIASGNATTPGVTLSRDTTAGNFETGSASLKVVCDGTAIQQGVFYQPIAQSAMVAGNRFGTMVRVKGTQNLNLEIYAISQGTGNVDKISNVTLNGNWQTFEVFDAVLGATKNPYVIVRTRGPAAAGTFYIDRAMSVDAAVPVPYFDGGSAAGDDFTYAWAGTANQSISYKRATLIGGSISGGAASVIQSTNWFSTGSKSLRVYSRYHTPGSAYGEMIAFAPDWGKTYTVKVKVRVREQLSYAPGIIAQTTGLTPNLYVGSYVPLTGSVVVPGVYDLSLTFSWPSFATGAAKYLRLYNSNLYGTSVWFDDLLVTEGYGKDLNGDPVSYFNGDTEDTGAHEYLFDTQPGSFNKSFKRELLTLAVPWIGLQSVDEEGGDSAAAYYIDGRPFLFLPRPKEYKASLKAMTYPDAFAEIMGVQEVADGMYLDSQPGSSFDLSYRTLVGNAIDGIDHGYKIHLVYNATVAPQALTYESMSNSINPTAFSWEIQAVPVPVEGFRPTAHIIIDTRHMSQAKIDAVEELIYGSETEVASMPSPQAIFDLLSFGDTIIVTDNGDGTFDVTGSYENVYMVGDGLFRVDNVDGQDNGDGTFTISTTAE